MLQVMFLLDTWMNGVLHWSVETKIVAVLDAIRSLLVELCCCTSTLKSHVELSQMGLLSFICPPFQEACRIGVLETLFKSFVLSFVEKWLTRHTTLFHLKNTNGSIGFQLGARALIVLCWIVLSALFHFKFLKSSFSFDTIMFLRKSAQ